MMTATLIHTYSNFPYISKNFHMAPEIIEDDNSFHLQNYQSIPIYEHDDKVYMTIFRILFVSWPEIIGELVTKK